MRFRGHDPAEEAGPADAVTLPLGGGWADRSGLDGFPLIGFISGWCWRVRRSPSMLSRGGHCAGDAGDINAGADLLDQGAGRASPAVSERASPLTTVGGRLALVSVGTSEECREPLLHVPLCSRI